ncbi:helix-turn-helix transcriptional regulator [Aquimarina celericrescens]|uniref:Helix-turn-helix transcriptional regulator n=1 Tax=Aquimarina celericrescens TaxID=1964542 RepID=A0ABW5AYB9_9FLAO|nr:helix-turn-helix transcriptional regulator [Aquimarina celericrescens]
MPNQNCHNIFLKKGHYLAPSYRTRDYGDFLVGLTEYKNPIDTGKWHFHEKPMISFVLYGGNVEFRKGKVITRVAGSANFYHSHEIHKNIYNCFPSKHISLELDSGLLKRYGYSASEVELAIQKNHNTTFTFIKLMNELQINDSQSSSAVEMLFLEFMEKSLKSKSSNQFPSWMKSVEELLNDRWDEHISLKELADHSGIHPTTISKNFRKYFQYSFGEYTRRLKVAHSLDFLHSSKYSITEIAYLCGFADQSHFTRVFKSLTGYLPKEYNKV